jgi:SAM-dependent methyltransferase
MLRRLREGTVVVDAEFDAIYPAPIRAASSAFWTPVSVALRAVRLLTCGATVRVLDVGSGPGKVCLIGAAVTTAEFVGVEQREHLVQAAWEGAERLGIAGAEFVHGTFEMVDIATFDAVYFFNPFEENVFVHECRLDETVTLSDERFFADIRAAESLLERARVGTRVVTYHGFGGRMPLGYRRVVRERAHSDYLELWIKLGTAPVRPVRSAARRPPARLVS